MLFIKNRYIIFSIVFLFFASFFVSRDAHAACVVQSIGVRQNAIPDNELWLDPDNNDETNFLEDFIIDEQPPFIYFDFQTTGCVPNDGNPDVSFTIYEEDDFYGIDPNAATSTLSLGLIAVYQNAPGATIDDPVTQNLPIDVPSDNFTVVYKAGDYHCDIYNPTRAECQYYIEYTDENNTDERWDAPQEGPDSEDTFLNYNCDGFCNDLSWVYQDTIAFETNHPLDSVGYTPGQNNLTGGGIQSTDYLAPLPGLAGQPSGLKGFLQGLFNVMIIIAGIAAVIMIVIGAITYVSADALSGKENGRVMMLNAVLGLILALGAWVIINTINPDLAESLNITIPAVNFNPAFEPGLIPAGTSQVTLDIIGGGQEVMTSCDESKIGTIDAFGHTFKIHQGLVDDIHDIEQEWLNNGGSNWYEIRSIGGYVCRNIHGTNIPSAHSYGLAVDINPDENPFHHTLVTDMLDLDPPPPDFTALWTSRGWGWGGDWTTVKDAMHFSKFGNEGGDLQINPY